MTSLTVSPRFDKTSVPGCPAAGRRLRHRLLQAALVLACASWAQAADARLHEVSYLLHRDGSEGFDTSDEAGHDSGPNNQRVRTHDTLEYHVGLNTLGADQHPRIQLTLPRGSHGAPAAAWSFLPIGCEANGSSLSADGQQIICQLGDFEATGSRTIFFTAHVLGSTPNGTRLAAPAIQVSSARTPAIQPATPTPPTVTITAAPFYDVRLDNSYQGLPKGHGYAEGSGPNGEDGFFHRPLIGLIARHPNGHGKKGVEQLDPATPVIVDLDLTGYRPSVRVDDWHMSEPPGERPTGSFADGCGSPSNGRPSRRSSGDRINVYERVHDSGPNASTDPQSVANGGDCQVLPGSSRQSVRLSISGIDSSLRHTPSVIGGHHQVIPATEFWVANKALVLWTDLDDYPLNTATANEIRLRSVSGRSISGQALRGDRPDNNQASYDVTRRSASEFLSNYGSDKSLSIPWATQPDPNVTSDDHVNQMVPGQVVRAFMRYSNTGTVAHENVMLCQKIDRTAFDPSPRFRVGVSSPVAHTVEYGAPATGASRFFASTDTATSPYQNETVDTPASPTGRSAYSRARCDTPGIRWFDNWQDAEAAGGVVYVRVHITRLPGGGNVFAHVYGMTLRSTWANTIAVETPSAHLRRQGEPITAGTIIRNQTIVHVDDHPPQQHYRLRDHLEVVPIRTHSRLTQRILTGNQGNQAVAAANTLLHFELTPHYSTYFPATPGVLTVTNVLPSGLRYRKGSGRLGGQPREPEIQPDTPAVGMTTLRWQYPPRTPVVMTASGLDTSVPPIEFEARLHATLMNDTVLKNHASVSGGTNDHRPDCRFDTATASYGHCAKSAETGITIQTPPGFMQGKLVLRELIEPGDPFGYRLGFVSMGQEAQAQDMPDMIDILPFEGDGIDNPANQFSARQPASRLLPGAYRLNAVVPPPVDPKARIYYTHQSPTRIHNDPRHPSNRLPGGSTRWCLAAELGSEGCPASIGESTAVRISPTLPVLHPNTLYEVTLHLETDPVLSRPGDIYANRVAMRPANPGSSLLLSTSMSDVQVAVQGQTGGLSGRVFVDHDQNLRMDAGDQALAQQCIQLDGITARHQHRFSLSMLTDQAGEFAFTPGQTRPVFLSADCSGKALSLFPGLPAGSYTLTKREAASRHLAGASQAGSLGGSAEAHRIHDITLPAGGMGTDYVLTERRAPAELTLRSTVTNDHGGMAEATAFELIATQQANGTRLQGVHGSAAVTKVQVPEGRYTLGTAPHTGYQPGSWQCTIAGQAPVQGAALTLNFGDRAECTVHFDDLPARLTLQKTVTNSHGQQARPEDFVLQADGPSPLSGTSGSAAVTARDVMAGSYQLGEVNLPNYVAGAWHCTAGTLNGETLTLANGEQAVCTINNTDQPVSLTLVLDIRNRYGGTATPSDHEVQADGPDHIRGISGTRPVTVAPVRPGVYELGEPRLPGYVTGKWVCSDGVLDGHTLTLSNQQNVTCRIELKDVPATLSLGKAVVGEVKPVEGTDSDYEVQYRLVVRHEAGAAGVYDLTDQPTFDPDVRIIGAQISRNGRPMDLGAFEDAWPLARRQPIGIGAEDVYLMTLRIHVPYGSNTRNNRCTAGTGPQSQHAADTAGRQGLLNRASLSNRMAEAGNDSPLSAHACIDTPTPASKARLSIDKRSTSRSAEVGDLVSYRLRIRNHGNGPAISPVVVDRLPAGFRYEPGSLKVQGARLGAVQLTGSRELRIGLDGIPAAPQTGPARSSAARQDDGAASTLPGDVIITYRVRLGVGSQEGDGTNRAHVACLTPDGLATQTCSNESRWTIRVRDGVFTEEACLAGQIFVDCNGNSVKDPDEPGMPDVRLYLQNGTWLISDEQGKYSHCGLRPRTHLLKVDARTLPRRSRLVTSSAQNAGDAHSLFIDARKGMLHRADFLEGSCSTTVMEEIAARQRRHQGEPADPGARPTGSQAVWFDSRR